MVTYLLGAVKYALPYTTAKHEYITKTWEQEVGESIMCNSVMLMFMLLLTMSGLQFAILKLMAKFDIN